MKLPKKLQNLIECLESLPGIGPKSAQRLAFYILKLTSSDVEKLSSSLLDVKEYIIFCDQCRVLDEVSPCVICQDSSRSQNMLVVVTSPMDVYSFEKMGYKGQYYVLHGNIDPLNSVGPEDLKIPTLVTRLKKILESEERVEVVIATSASLEGEATAMYLSREIKGDLNLSSKIKVTRLARGIPVGGDIEYADDITLSRAFEGRSGF